METGVHLTAEGQGYHQNGGTEEMDREDQGTEEVDVDTQNDIEIFERQSDFDSQPIYDEEDIQNDIEIFERQTDFDSQPIYDEEDTQNDIEIFERQSDFDSQPIYDEEDTQNDIEIFERQSDFDSQPIYDEEDTEYETEIFERQTDFDSQPIYDEEDTQNDIEIFERQTDFDSQPIYDEEDTQNDIEIFERQSDFDSQPIYDEEDTQNDIEIFERQSDFDSQPIYDEEDTEYETEIFERQTDFDSQPIYDEEDTQNDIEIFERQTDFDSQPIYDEEDTQNDIEIFERQSDFNSQPIYDEADTEYDIEIFERQTDFDSQPIYDEEDTQNDIEIFERQSDFDSQPIYDKADTEYETEIFERGSEMRKKEYIHSDIFMDIYLLQTQLKECGTKYIRIPGYIQLFSMDPFIVHLYTECGLSILLHHLRSRSPVALYLDATGGVVSKTPEQPKRVLYYAVVLPGKDRDVPPLPVCEMLSNDHSVPAITFWLMQFTMHLSKYTKTKIHQVETDYSWALIQSVMLAFNKEDISSYLNRAYELCMGKKSGDEIKSFTVLHICSARILKAVRQAICRQTDDKGLRDFATFAFARLQNASDMTESRIVFRALCALLTTPQITNLVKESLCVLESVISRSKEDTLEETTQSKDWEMCESEDRRHATTITGRSPFSAYFQQVMQEVKEQVADDETWLVKEDNPHFCPGIITVLFDTYLAIFPLWSGLLLGDLSRYESHEQDLVTTKKQPKTRDTNCHVEKWFGIVKHSIMQTEKKVKPGTFIRKMHQSLQTRYTENIIQHKLPHKLLLQPEPPVNLDQSQESWMKKEEPVLSVEEEVNMLWKKPPTKLVVAFVKSPRHNEERMLHHRQFQTLRPHKWINGETTECYLRAVLNMKGANLYQLSFYTTDAILNGTWEQMARQRLRKVNFEQYDGLITFLNINKNHWRLVYLHAKCDTIFILDSRRGTNEKEKAKETCQKFGDFFQMRENKCGKMSWAKKEWKPGTIKHSFQKDCSSCGVFVMLMAKQVVEEFPKIPDRIHITPSKEMMDHYRTKMAKDILLASVSREEYCSVCAKSEESQIEDQITWIQCELCKRWFHIECLNITVPPKEQAWFCDLCS